MSPQAQIDTLRSIAIANPNDAQVAFLAGNAFYARGSEIGSAEQPRVQAYFDSATWAYRHAVIVTPRSPRRGQPRAGAAGPQPRPQAAAGLREGHRRQPRGRARVLPPRYLHQSIGNVEEGSSSTGARSPSIPTARRRTTTSGWRSPTRRSSPRRCASGRRSCAWTRRGPRHHRAENVKIIRQYLDAKP